MIGHGRGLIENTITSDINLRLLQGLRSAAYTFCTLVLGLGLGLGSVSNGGEFRPGCAALSAKRLVLQEGILVVGASTNRLLA